MPVILLKCEYGFSDCMFNHIVFIGRTGYSHDVIEMQSKMIPQPESIYNEIPSMDNEKDLKMEENPAYQIVN